MQDQSTKKCETCKQVKPIHEFHLHSGNQDGHQHRCKVCRRAFHVTSYAPVRDKEQLPSGCKRCRKCYQIKPITEFYVASQKQIEGGGYKDGRDYTCKKCELAAAKRYQQSFKSGPARIVSEKRCRGCDTVKPSSEFHRDRRRSDWLYSSCKECVHKKQGDTAPYLRRWHLKRKYKITEEEAWAILGSQGGRCAICSLSISYSSKKRSLDQAHIDHDHKTGKVRGILCRRCNIMLYAIELPEFVVKARKYLKKHADELHAIQRRAIPDLFSDG